MLDNIVQTYLAVTNMLFLSKSFTSWMFVKFPIVEKFVEVPRNVRYFSVSERIFDKSLRY